MNALVLLNLLNEFVKQIRNEALPSKLSIRFSRTSLINSIKQEHKL